MSKIVLKGNIELNYQLLRKDIRNINMRISREGNLIVSAPLKISQKLIDDVLISKSNWIIKKIEHMKKRQNIFGSNQIEIISGQDYYFFGKKYKILVELSMNNSININSKKSIVHVKSKNITNNSKLRRLFIDWEDDQFKNQILSIITYYDHMLKKYKLKIKEVRIKNMKSCWGNCFPNRGIITINKRLLNYDKKCLEYVVVHELAHFVYANHSKEFYNLIEFYLPTYKDAINELEG